MVDWIEAEIYFKIGNLIKDRIEEEKFLNLA